MALLKFGRSLKQQRTGGSYIVLNNSGAVTFSKAAVTALEMKAGQSWSFIQDEDNPSDWYLVRDEEEGFPIRFNKDDETCMFNCSAFFKTFVEAFEYGDDVTSVKLNLVTDEVTTFEDDENQYYALITADAAVRRKKQEEQETTA